MPRLSTIVPFSQCFIPDEVAGAESYVYPLVVDREKLFEYKFRIKKWNVAFEGSYEYDVDDGISPIFQVIGSFDDNVDVDSDFSTEKELVCDSLFTGSAIITTGTVDYNGVTATTEVSIDLSIAGGFKVTGSADEYIPVVVANFEIYDPGNSPYLKIGNLVTPSGEVFEQNFEGSTWSDVPCNHGISLTVTNFVASGSYTITPVEWWEHDPGDGLGPVWDSTDGSQLRNPFSC
jgi:hypothetical protein